jgi:hypothetical protein
VVDGWPWKNLMPFFVGVFHPPFSQGVSDGNRRKDFAKPVFNKFVSKNLEACFLTLPLGRGTTGCFQPIKKNIPATLL